MFGCLGQTTSLTTYLACSKYWALLTILAAFVIVLTCDTTTVGVALANYIKQFAEIA